MHAILLAKPVLVLPMLGAWLVLLRPGKTPLRRALVICAGKVLLQLQIRLLVSHVRQDAPVAPPEKIVRSPHVKHVFLGYSRIRQTQRCAESVLHPDTTWVPATCVSVVLPTASRAPEPLSAPCAVRVTTCSTQLVPAAIRSTAISARIPA